MENIQLNEKHYKRMRGFLENDLTDRDEVEKVIILNQIIKVANELLGVCADDK